MLPWLTEPEERLLPLLTTNLSFAEIARLLGGSRDEVEAMAISVYEKLGLARSADGSRCA